MGLSVRERSACHTAPLFLRLALGAVFLWAGFGKIMATALFSPEEAAILANYGVVSPGGALPEFPVEPASWPITAQEEVIRDRTPPPALDEDDPADMAANAASPAGPIGAFGPGDFPTGAEAERLHQITVTLHQGMYPGHNPDGTRRMPLWFDPDATTDFDPWPTYFAWAVAVSEIAAGGFLVLGLLTRLGGLMVFGIMLGAMWLTQIGPALQSGDTALAFLPNYDPFSIEPGEWQALLFQLLCGMSGLAIFLAGSGALALDRLVFGNPFGIDRAAKKP